MHRGLSYEMGGYLSFGCGRQGPVFFRKRL